MEGNDHTTTDEPTPELKNFHGIFDSEDDVRDYADEFETVTVTLTYDSSYSDDKVTFSGELAAYGDWGFIVRQYDDCRIVQGGQVKTDTGDNTRCIGKNWQVTTESVEEAESGNEESNRGISEFTDSSLDDDLHGTTDYPGVSGKVLTAECRAYVVQSDGVHDAEEWAEPDEDGILRGEDSAGNAAMYGVQGWHIEELDTSELETDDPELATDGGMECPNEPERRNQYGEPMCDECGMVVVDRPNSDFGGGCVCKGCRDAYNRELEREFDATLVTDGGEDCPVEPQVRIEGEPVCDDCRLRVVNIEESGFGDACLCQDCQEKRLNEFEREFTLTGDDQVSAEEKTRIVMPMDISTETTDRRGRFTLGKKYANQRVTIALVDVERGDDDG